MRSGAVARAERACVGQSRGSRPAGLPWVLAGRVPNISEGGVRDHSLAVPYHAPPHVSARGGRQGRQGKVEKRGVDTGAVRGD